MSGTIPLIRAGALIPMLRWMSANRRPIEQRLAEVDLGCVAYVDPNQPIPLRNAAAFFANAARDEGPDIACRVVSENSVRELALVGRVVLGAPTPRAALERVSAMMPYHSSHEFLTVGSTPSGIEIGEGWTIQFDDMTLHVIHQFFAAIIREICSLTQAPEPLLSRIEMVPHPDFGLAHLRKWFTVPPVASGMRFIRIGIDASVADRKVSNVARDRVGGGLPPGIAPLSGDGSLKGSARTVLLLHLLDGAPSVDRLARAAGMSRRTLQRQLAAESTSFSGLLEEVRRELALRHLEESKGSMDEVAARLGYARQSTLTRAVRRWTGRPPSEIRGR